MTEAAPSNASNPATLEHGFLTSRLAQLPLAARAILCFIGVAAGLFLCFFAIYGQRWLSLAGRRKREDSESQSSRWFKVEGGLTGIVTGAILVAYAVLLAILAGLSRSSKPSLGAWSLVIIPFIASIILGPLLARWKWLSRLSLGIVGGLSVTTLIILSAHIKARTARLILLVVILSISLVLCSLLTIPQLQCRRIAARCSLFFASVIGTLSFVTAIDIFTRVGLVDALGLFVSDTGVATSHDVNLTTSTVIQWDEPAYKGLIAGGWLLILIGTAFQCWRYQVIGDDPDEEWNSYLGTMLDDEKTYAGRTPLVDNNRTGFFSAKQPFFKRLFASSSSKRSQPATYSSVAMPGLAEGTEQIDDELEKRPLASIPMPQFPHKIGESYEGGPARYDQTYAGLGLYDDPYENMQRSNSYLPQYYLARNVSEPSFRSVPEYSPANYTPSIGLRTPSLSGFTVISNSSMEGDTAKDSKTHRKKAEVVSTDVSVDEGVLQTVFGVATVQQVQENKPTAVNKPLRIPAKRIPSPTSPHSASSSPIIPRAEENPFEQIAVQATPSLLNAIKRVSDAQQQAKEWRSKQANRTSPLGKDEAVLKAAAARRRQSSHEWWEQVDRRASGSSATS